MLKNKTAVVTGSTSGIGLGIARALAQAGANVMLNGFGDAAVIEKLRGELAASTGVRVLYHPADVTKPEEVAALIAAAESACGSVDILVNNAGIQFVSPVEDFPVDRWLAIQAVILNSSFYAIRTALPGMKRRNWGRILNLVSVHGLVASPFKSAYVAAKHGVVGLTRGAALDYARQNIRVNAVCPGMIDTPMAASIPPDLLKALLDESPMGRQGRPEEIAAAVLWLCDPASSFVTGQAIPVDGAWTTR